MMGGNLKDWNCSLFDTQTHTTIIGGNSVLFFRWALAPVTTPVVITGSMPSLRSLSNALSLNVLAAHIFGSCDGN